METISMYFNLLQGQLMGLFTWLTAFPSDLVMIAVYLIGWYLASKIYSGIFNVVPKNLYNTKDIIAAQKTQTGWGAMLSPITAVLAFLYNFGNTILWFLGELISWAVKGIMWVYNQIVVAGLFLVLRVLWHYLVMWPWNLLKLAFSQIMPSLNKELYLIALKGLFIACIIAFSGRFLTEHFQTSAVIENLLTLISLLPIGWTAGQIALIATKSKMDNKDFRQRYTKHALFILGFGLLVAGGTWLLVNLGSRSSFAYSLSSLFIGGSLIGGAFLILSALMFIFLLSALPSFSRDYKGDYKGFPAAFGNHIYQKGARYLLALPAMLIPAIILTIVPYYLSKGFAYTASKITDNVYEGRLKNVQDAVAKASIPGYDAWEDFHAIKDDSLQKLITADQKLLDLKSQLEILNTNHQYLRDFYGNNSDSLAAAPIGGAYFIYDSYDKQQRDRINIRAYEKIAIDSQAFAGEIKTSDESAKAAKDNANNKQKQIDALNAELAKVCVADSNTNSVQNQPTTELDTTIAAAAQADNRDDCQKQRDFISAGIAYATKEKASLDSQLTRSNMVNAHIKSMRSRLNAMQSNRNFSSLLGHLLATGWYSLLMAFAFALALVLFARVNSEIYMHKDKTNSWMIMDELENAKSANPNQPLLGLGILAIIVLSYLGSASCWNPTNWDLGLYKPNKMECCDTTGKSCGSDSIIINSQTEPAAPAASPAQSSPSENMVDPIQQSDESIQEVETVQDYE